MHCRRCFIGLVVKDPDGDRRCLQCGTYIYAAPQAQVQHSTRRPPTPVSRVRAIIASMGPTFKVGDFARRLQAEDGPTWSWAQLREVLETEGFVLVRSRNAWGNAVGSLWARQRSKAVERISTPPPAVA